MAPAGVQAAMEKPDHTPDESKVKRPSPLKAVQPWAVGLAGAGLMLLSGGAFWLWKQAQEETRALHPHSASWHSRGKQVFEGAPAKVFSDAAEEHESDSLEDVLSKLEGGEAVTASLPRKSMATVGGRKEGKKPKAKESKRPKAQDLSTSELKSELGDDEKAKEVIRDTLRKLEEDGEAGKKGTKTRKTVEKLKALLGEVEEPEPQELSEDQQSHMDFAKALQEEQQRKVHVEMKTVKSEFKRDFGSDARALLCSGCKLVASRLSSEFDTHDVHDQESPAQMLAAKRKAIDSTCSSLRHLQAVKPDEGEPGVARFEASEVTGEGEREGKRLCAAILEESRFDILARLIQRKIPEMQHLAGGRNGHSNWERWLCAERMRLCKRSEVKDDDDEEIEQQDL